MILSKGTALCERLKKKVCITDIGMQYVTHPVPAIDVK